MKRDIAEIAGDFDELEHADFDEPDAHDRLNDLCNELAGLERVSDVASVMFRFMEHLPEADIGRRGPLVHTLEAKNSHEPLPPSHAPELQRQTRS